jgi:drug/metabolite transporter (DMT)-like permease
MTQTYTKSQKIFADLGLFYSAAIWGSTFIIVKSALDGIDPVILVAYRFLIAGLLMSIYLLLTKRNIFQNLKHGFWLAVILWFLYVPQTVGLKYTTASNSGFITGLFIAFVPIFLKIIFKKNPTLMETVAAIISIIGLWVLTGGLTDINTGDILTLMAAVTYALHVLYGDRFIKSGTDPLVLSCQQFLLVGLFSLLYGLIFDLQFNLTTNYAFGALIFLALFPTLSAFVIQMMAQKITTPIKVSLIFAFEPVFAALFAWTFGNETIIAHRAFGGLLIFIAIVISGFPTPTFLNKMKNTINTD